MFTRIKVQAGSKIKNPIEQKLKVEFSEENLDEIKKAADDAPYALQVKLQEMELAAPATLEVTLNEKWDADRVLYCIYEDEQLYQLDDAKIENAGKAKILLDRLVKRKELGLATARQIRLLEARGFQHVGTWTFEAASKLIARIAASGWRMPKGIVPAQYQPD